MTKPDVLVVGGGPVGLTMGCELLRHGVSCRLIDQNPEPQVWSKAAGVAARTMEVWHDMGIVDRALERGRPMHGVNLYNGTDRIAHLDIRIPGTPFPYLFGMSQRKTELMLAELFAELGGTFEREVRLDDINQSDDDVEVTLVHKDGRQEEVEVGQAQDGLLQPHNPLHTAATSPSEEPSTQHAPHTRQGSTARWGGA